MKTSDEITEITKALVEVQGSMDPARMLSKNSFFSSSYANLDSVWSALRVPLHSNGLAVVQEAVTLDGGVHVSTRILHVSGQWIECGPVAIPMKKNDAHATGSAITYGKRYGLVAALGMAGEKDDDGNKAVEEDYNKNNSKEPFKEDPEPKGKLSEPQLRLINSYNIKIIDKVMTRLHKSYGYKKIEDVDAHHFNNISKALEEYREENNATTI